MLPTSDYQRLLAVLRPVRLAARQVLYRPDEVGRYIFFPRSGLISLIVTLEDGRAVETGFVGYEGVVGLYAFFGAERATYEAIVQAPGDALQLGAGVFREETRRNAALAELLLRYTQLVLTQTAQLAACNGLHSVEQRCARWLLMARDSTRLDALPLTHLWLSTMLGVRRASVSAVLATLVRSGSIRSTRGRVTITSAAELERAACECYATIRRSFAWLRGDSG
jgi:CRP-like cAMP-binding protein